MNPKIYFIVFVIVSLAACSTFSSSKSFHDPEMDFGALRTIAVMPFSNLTGDKLAAERVRNTFMTSLMATGVVYVIPSGEVVRGIRRAALEHPTVPSTEDVAKLAAIIRADAVITGVLKEYGEVRSGTTTANIISLSLQMIERESRRVVWTAATTKGGISAFDRLFGGGGQPMNNVTQAAINDILNQLFY